MAKRTERAQFPVVVHTLVLAPPGTVLSAGAEKRDKGLSSHECILLLRRRGTGYGDGLLQPPGGYVQRGEGVLAAAVRELAEETGLRVASSALVPVAAMPYYPLIDQARVAPNHAVHRASPEDGARAGIEGVDFLFALPWSAELGEPKIGEPQKCDGIGWFAVTSPPRNAVPFLNAALEARSSGNWFREF